MTDSPITTTWSHSFLLKDLTDHGLAVVKGKRGYIHNRAHSLSGVLPAILAADNLFEEATGVPNFDLHIWLALATMLIGAGDVIFSGVTAKVGGLRRGQGDDETMKWDFSLDFSEPSTESVWLESLTDSHPRMVGDGGEMDISIRHGRFLSVTRLLDERLVSASNPVIGDALSAEDVVAKYIPDEQGFAWRAMGEITEKDLAVKMITYPASVHPALKDRAIANIPLYIAAKLGDAGLSIREHWFPEDTSKSFARYILTDGIDHFVMDFHGGHLAVLLSHLDKYIGREADMGGIQLDGVQPTVIALDQARDAMDSLTIHQHPPVSR